MGTGDMIQAQIDTEDAVRYRWLKKNAATTGHLWQLLSQGGPTKFASILRQDD